MVIHLALLIQLMLYKIWDVVVHYFITRPAIMHYMAKLNDLEWTTKDLFNVISNGTLKSNLNYEIPLKHALKAHEVIESLKIEGSRILLP